MAVDAHGSVDDRSLEAQRFTSEGCLDHVHSLRKECDAVLVGVETVVRDNPQLTVRRVETERQPLRVIIDPNQRIPEDALLLNDEHQTLVMGKEFNSLPALLNLLGDQEIQRLMVEGGPTTIGNFLDQGLVDEFYLIHSEVTHQQPVASNIDAERLSSAGLSHTATDKWGDETVHLWTRN
jgi:riboflavin biosynthesis pyrimidine reductase